MENLLVNEGELIRLAVEWGGKFVIAIVILILGWAVGSWIDGHIDRIKRLDSTLRTFLGNVIKYGIMVVSIITVIGLFGVPMTSFIAVLGAAGLAIGLALQGTLSNVAAGVMLLILRPFNVGDYIDFGTGGTVKSLGLFGTELAMADNVYVFTPNSQIWGNTIRNFSRNTTRRQDILVGIAYEDDINKAFKIIHDLLEKEERIIVNTERKAEVMVDTLGAYSINIIIRFWSKSSDYWQLRWDMTKAIKEALDKGGITIPYPIQASTTHLDDLNANREKKKS